MSYASDRAFSDTFIPRSKEILGRHVIRMATEHEDQKLATDLRLLITALDNTSHRVFRFASWQAYPHDHTIRDGRPTGAKTEFAKLVDLPREGLYFIGWASEGDRDLAHYVILDNGALFRHPRSGAVRHVRSARNWRTDGTTFRVYDLLRLPDDVVLFTSDGYREQFASCACKTCRARAA